MSQKRPLNKLGIGLVIILMSISYGVGRYLQPAKVVEVEKIVTKDQIKTSVIVKETTKPDGTVIKETKNITDVKKETDTEKNKTVIKDNPQWTVSALVGKDTSWNTTIGAAIQKNILGEFSGGVYVIPMGSKMQGGFIFSYEF